MTDIVSMLNGRIDGFLIMGAFTAAGFAEYHAAAWQIPLITSIAYIVGSVSARDLAQHFQRGQAEHAVQLWRTSIEKVSLVVTPLALVFIVAAEEVMELLFTADYLRGAQVFRIYACLTALRTAAFGSVIVAAGRPRLVLLAAAVALVSNVMLSVPALWLFGFEGPAIGTGLAFIPMVGVYCWCIARATGLRVSQIYPVIAHARVLLLGAVACLPALAFKIMADWSAAPSLLVQALLILSGFAALGTLTGQIGAQEWRFMLRWLTGRTASSP